MIVRTRRRLGVAAAAALALAAILALSGCSAPAEESSAGGVVQVNTPQGPVTINGTPTRIVTLGGQWIDTALAFGVTPVAYLDQNEILTKKASPWVGDKLAGSTALGTENLVAEIAKARPDVILAEGFMATSQPETFAKIRELAPTIPGVTGKQVDPWSDLVTLFGTITGKTDEATAIIDRVNGAIDQVKTDLPGLAGKTYSLAYMYSSDQIQVMADPSDGAGALFGQLGMKVAPALAAQFAKNGQPRFPISTENVPLLEADYLVVTTGNEAMAEQLRKLPGYSSLTAVRDGSVSDLTVTEIGGLNQPTPLSIPYLLEQIRPQLNRVAA